MMFAQTKLDSLVARHAELEAGLAAGHDPDNYVKLSREFAELSPIVEKVKAWRAVMNELKDIEALLADPATDSEMKALAAAEKPALEERRDALQQDIRLALLPKDAMDERNVLLEIRA